MTGKQEVKFSWMPKSICNLYIWRPFSPINNKHRCFIQYWGEPCMSILHWSTDDQWSKRQMLSRDLQTVILKAKHHWTDAWHWLFKTGEMMSIFVNCCVNQVIWPISVFNVGGRPIGSMHKSQCMYTHCHESLWGNRYDQRSIDFISVAFIGKRAWAPILEHPIINGIDLELCWFSRMRNLIKWVKKYTWNGMHLVNEGRKCPPLFLIKTGWAFQVWHFKKAPHSLWDVIQHFSLKNSHQVSGTQ